MKLNSIFLKCVALLLFSFSFYSLHAQNGNAIVTGKVTDENGKGMVGVTVTVKGTSATTVTDADGAYKLSAPAGKAVLVFTYVGYQAQEIAVNKRSVVNLTLSLSQKLLDDVVVIGYGTQKKGSVTGALVLLPLLVVGTLQILDAGLVNLTLAVVCVGIGFFIGFFIFSADIRKQDRI